MSKTNHRDGTKARQDRHPNYELRKSSLKAEAHVCARRASMNFVANVRKGSTDPLNAPPVRNRHFGNPWHWD